MFDVDSYFYNFAVFVSWCQRRWCTGLFSVRVCAKLSFYLVKKCVDINNQMGELTAFNISRTFNCSIQNEFLQKPSSVLEHSCTSVVLSVTWTTCSADTLYRCQITSADIMDLLLTCDHKMVTRV